MKILVRQKLEVVNKTPSNIFGWRGHSRRVSASEVHLKSLI